MVYNLFHHVIPVGNFDDVRLQCILLPLHVVVTLFVQEAIG